LSKIDELLHCHGQARRQRRVAFEQGGGTEFGWNDDMTGCHQQNRDIAIWPRRGAQGRTDLEPAEIGEGCSTDDGEIELPMRKGFERRTPRAEMREIDRQFRQRQLVKLQHRQRRFGDQARLARRECRQRRIDVGVIGCSRTRQRFNAPQQVDVGERAVGNAAAPVAS